VVSTVLQVNWPLAQQVKVRIQCDQGISRPNGEGGPGRVVGAQDAGPVEPDLSQGLRRDRHQVILPQAGPDGVLLLSFPRRAPNPCERVPDLGWRSHREAMPGRLDAVAASWTMTAEEDGPDTALAAPE
jgi:hypothetical protein